VFRQIGESLSAPAPAGRHRRLSRPSTPTSKGEIERDVGGAEAAARQPAPAWTAVQVVRLLPDNGIAEIKIVARRSRAAAARPGGGRMMWRSISPSASGRWPRTAPTPSSTSSASHRLAACLMLLLYVRYERSYDEWLTNVENVYQLQAKLTDPGTREVTNISHAFIAGETLRKDFPQIEAKTYLMRLSRS
jgi:hypothetical protein